MQPPRLEVELVEVLEVLEVLLHVLVGATGVLLGV